MNEALLNPPTTVQPQIRTGRPSISQPEPLIKAKEQPLPIVRKMSVALALLRRKSFIARVES